MKDLFSIEGKVALVTGGSRGIGEMIAAGFLANGARVYISSRKADVCEATARRLAEEHGGECSPLPADLSGVQGSEALAEALAERESRLAHGERRSMTSPRPAGTRSWTRTSRACSS